ncbi:NAD-dependent epimerase/dehydratase family protein [Pedobacter sp. L105]|uniref:NAD-dependent epimerase/dehydratase family protein n=1 Tax=Pedobacter sp. L105 TaxID=1641871 RepID=UPI00131D9A85|nr:NAD-dependent epimerase/dehydratase family protein [Pedobacter sp. L105]
MNILLTGSSGFLGKIICDTLKTRFPSLQTLGRSIQDNIKFDFALDNPVTITSSFDLIIHCAGKAHSVPKSASDAEEFFKVNVDGTRLLLDGLSMAPQIPKFFIFISTVAVYGKEEGTLIDETSPLLAVDPYGLSKIQAEILVQKWCDEHAVIYTILRLPLIAGPCPPGNLKSMIRGIEKGYYFNIDNGKAKKSIVLAEDVAIAILKVFTIGGIYNLTDREHPSFYMLSSLIARQLGRSTPKKIPLWLAVVMAKAGDLFGQKFPITSNKLKKITSDLTFDDTKAVETFSWNPGQVLNSFKII